MGTENQGRPYSLKRRAKSLRVNTLIEAFHEAIPYSCGEIIPLTRVYNLYRSMGLRYLSVVDIDNKLAGIKRKELITMEFTSDLFKLKPIHFQITTNPKAQKTSI